MTSRVKPRVVAVIVLFLLSAVGSADAATFGVATGAQVETDQLVPPEASAAVACWYDFGATLTGWSGGADCPHGGVVNMPPGSTVTYSGTPGAAGQTASFAQAAVSWSGTSGTASGAADLAQGTLRASTSLNGVTGLFFISSGATAQFGDSLTFSIPGAGPSTVTNIDVYYRVNGIYSTNFGGTQVTAYMNFGQAAMQYVAGYEPCCDNLPPHIMTQTSSGWVSADFSGTTTSAVIFHGVYALQGASPVIPNFIADLDVSCRADEHTPPTTTVCDYGNRTGRVHLALPPGVTFTADSGVFNPFRTSAHDFNGDDTSDLLWRDTAGDVALWPMSGSQVLQAGVLGNAGTTWSIVGQRDFDGDGLVDLLWRDSSGNVAMWFLSGTQVTGVAGVGNVPTVWSVAGTADFNGDGKGDILWHDTAGNVAIWLMNGAQVTQSTVVGNAPTNVWKIAGTGDFNGDGKADILWQDGNGNVAIWFMNGAQVIGSAAVGNAPPSVWTIVGTGDFNGDGKSDILWHDTAGNVAIWLLNGAQVTGSAGVGNAPPNVWSIVETGDFDGDGKSDILWQDTSGNVAMWLMNGTQVASLSGVGNVPTAVWTIQNLNAD